jgi:hypothetical protein
LYTQYQAGLTFFAHQTGLVAASFDSSESARIRSQGPALKRKLEETDFEVADSDEDYGWAPDEDGDSMPPQPSQWQGSEDLLLGTHRQTGQDSDDEREQLHPDDEIPASDEDDDLITQQDVRDAA